MAWEVLFSAPVGQEMAHRARNGARVVTVRTPVGQQPTNEMFEQAFAHSWAKKKGKLK